MTLPVWLEKQWHQLQANAGSGRLGHALMLTGPVGVGKRLLADELIRLVMCSEGAIPACGHCRSCEVAAAGNHPDYHLLEVPADKTTIGVDQVRDLIEHLNLSATYQNRKIGLISPAESMTIAAANAVLKTLEEPPGNTLMILISHQSWRLPATIMSRCQLIQCGAPATAIATEWLEQQQGGGDWRVSLELASGAPFQAIKYKNQEIDVLFSSIIDDLYQLKSGRAELVSVANKWTDPLLPVRLIALYRLLRQLILQTMELDGELAHKTALQSLHNEVRHIKLSALLGYQEAVLRTRKKLDTQLNQQLMMEELLAPWVTGFRHYELESLNL